MKAIAGDCGSLTSSRKGGETPNATAWRIVDFGEELSCANEGTHRTITPMARQPRPQNVSFHEFPFLVSNHISRHWNFTPEYGEMR